MEASSTVPLMVLLSTTGPFCCLDSQIPAVVTQGQVHTVALLIPCPFQLLSKLPMKVKNLVMHSNSPRKRKKCLKRSNHAQLWISSILQDLEGLGSNFFQSYIFYWLRVSVMPFFLGMLVMCTDPFMSLVIQATLTAGSQIKVI